MWPSSFHFCDLQQVLNIYYLNSCLLKNLPMKVEILTKPSVTPVPSPYLSVSYHTTPPRLVFSALGQADFSSISLDLIYYLLVFICFFFPHFLQSLPKCCFSMLPNLITGIYLTKFLL